MSDQPTNPWKPTASEIKRWAFDPNFELITEELFDEMNGSIDESHFFEEAATKIALLKYADDVRCEKQDEILGILDEMIRTSMIYGVEEFFLWVPSLINPDYDFKSNEVIEWREKQRKRWRYWKGIGVTSKDKALKIASAFFCMNKTDYQLKIFKETREGWITVFRRKPWSRSKEFILVRKDTGRFVYYYSDLPSHYTFDPEIAAERTRRNRNEMALAIPQ